MVFISAELIFMDNPGEIILFAQENLIKPKRIGGRQDVTSWVMFSFYSNKQQTTGQNNNARENF